MKKRINHKKIKDLLLEKKILWISIVLLLVIIIIFLIFVKYKEKGYPVQNIINQDETLQKTHCLDSICIEGMMLSYYKDGLSSISGFMTNAGKERRDACLKIKFILNGQDETIDFNTCYWDLGIDEKVPIETYFGEDQKELVFAVDYQLDYLTDDELQMLQDAREKDEND